MTTHNNIVGAQLAARIFGIALVALFLAAPNTALADECGPQILPGTPETFTCAPGDYNDGITYSSDGDLTLQVTDDSDHLDVFETGIDVTGNGGDSVFWDSSTFINNDIRGTGIVLDYASGTGDIDIVIGGDVQAQGDAVHAIRATSDSGDVSINIISNGSTGSTFNGVNSGSASAITVDTGGDAQIDIGEGRRANASGATTALNLTAAGQTTVNNAGVIAAGSGMAIQTVGDSLVLNNDDQITGRLDFSGLDNGYTFNNNAGALWNPSGASGQVADIGMGALNNAGTIQLGRGDYISAPGTTFTGSGDSVLEVRSAILDGEGQSDCTAPTVASCLDLSGGGTSGQTGIIVVAQKLNSADNPLNDVVDKYLNPGIVLVDVSGGTSHAGDFVLHPDSRARIDRDPESVFDDIVVVPLYAEDEKYGAVLKTGGLFDYALLYNPNTQQHILSSVPQHEAVAYINSVQESLSIWHTTSDAVVGRQADLREGGERGGWVRIVSDSIERDAAPTLTTHGNTFTYDQDYSQDIRAIIGGYDLSASADHVFGVHIGFISSRLEYDEENTMVDKTTAPSSVTMGVYGGWWNEAGLTLDGTLNATLLELEHDVRAGLEDSKTNVKSLGARVEAGWRLPLLDERFYVQPLATAAYVTADLDRIDLRYNNATFENTESSRAALGVRLGGGMDLANDRFSRLKYWLTARAWEEYAGDDVELRYEVAGGDDLVIEDDISGTFEEVGLGVSLTSPDENLSVFLSGNIQSGDQTDSTNVTIGARLRW